MFGLKFFINSVLLGVGLAMDAAAVSMANGFKEPKMKAWKTVLIALFFGIFQGIMPLIGYFAGRAVLSLIEKIIPYLSLIILLYLGIKMIYGAVKKKEKEEVKALTLGVLIMQAIATSLDALTVGFTLAEMVIVETLVCAAIIMTETFIISISGVFIGKKIGTRLGGKAEIFGGAILIFIGLEIFITSFF